MRIAFFELEGWEEPKLREALPGHELILSRDPLEPETVRSAEGAEVVSVFIRSKVGREVIDALPRLRAVVTRSTGYDHIDLEYCRKRGVAVFNVPDYGPDTVAEHTIMLLLMLARRVNELRRALERSDFSPLTVRGWELAGKTIGVVGTGRIGSRVAKLARAFGMRVLAYDVVENRELKEQYGVEYVDFDTLLSSCDVITLHAPLTPQTRHLINRSNIRKIKRGALLVNTARGGLVETEALIEALDEGILAGAALDVVEGEWILGGDWRRALKEDSANPEQYRDALLALKLANHPNVVLTPHVAYNTWEALGRIWSATIETVRAIAEGRQPANIVV